MKKFAAVTVVLWLSINISAQPGTFSLTSPANGAWASARPTFQWGAASGASYYRLFVDGVLKDDNLTAATYQLTPTEALAEPLHTWYVVAVDGSGGTTQSTQTYTAMIDATPPAAFNLIGPSDGSWINSLQPTLQWSSSSDTRSGLAKYQLWVDGVLNRDNISSTSTSTTPINSLSNSSHSWQVKAVDSVGNVGNSAQTFTVKIDNVPPTFVQNIIVKPSFTIPWNGYNISSGSWNIYDSLNNPLLGGVFACGFRTNCTDNVLFTPPSTGTFFFQFITAPLAGTYGFSDSFHVSNAFAGNGTYGVSYTSPQTRASFIVGVDGTGVFSPSGGIFLANNKPTFTWCSARDTGAGFQKYQVYIDNNLVQDNLTDTFFTITTPLGYGPHTWIVKACDVLGNFAPMFPMQFYIDNQPPKAFNLLTPLDSAVVNIPTPNLIWQATTDSAGGSGLSKYQLWINGAKNIDSIAISLTTTAPSVPLAEGSYSWYVKAFDKVGNVRTSTQTRTFFVDFNPPGAFTLVSPAKGDTIKASRPKFVWHQSVDGGSGIKRYVLNVSGQVPDTIATADTSAQFPITLSNAAYTWFVVAYDRGNNSKGSDTGNFFVNVLPPTVPILASPTNKSSNQPTLLSLKWYSSIGADTYKIQVSTDSTFSSVLAENKSSVIDTTDSVSTALSQNTLYYWRVNATNSATTCAWSEIWSFMTIVPVPSKVSIISPVNTATIAVDSVSIIWSKGIPSVDKYCFEMASDSLFATKITSDSSISDTTRMCRGLADKTTYWFHVKAHNSSGWGSYSDARKFSVNIPSSVIMPKTYSFHFNGMSASKGFIRYSLPEASNVSFRLFDVQGKLIRTFINASQAAGYYQIPVNVADLGRGCYLVDFKAGNYIVKKKMSIL